MEITVDSINDVDLNYDCDAYTVHMDNHRILTIVTYSELTVAKWVKDAVKSQNTKLSKTVVVGLAADSENIEYTKKGLRDTPYNLIQLCIGSHCLLFHLPEVNDHYNYTPPKSLQKFLSDPRVMAIGVNIKAVAKKLERDYEIKIAEAVDINELAVQGMKREDLDLGRYDLDRLANAVLGKNVYVERPEKMVEWYERRRGWWYDGDLRQEKVMYSTVDAYFCFKIGYDLIQMIIHGPPASGDSSKKKEKKKARKMSKKK